MSLSIIILAAGRSTRMKSTKSKILHKLAGKSLINHVIDNASKVNSEEIIVVVSDNVNEIKNDVVNKNVKFAIQKELLGTADAVKSGLNNLEKESEYILILCGDTPLIPENILEEFYTKTAAKNSGISIIAFNSANPYGYGRLVLNGDYVEKIVETKDANIEELKIHLCNSAIILIKSEMLKELLPQIDNNNSQKEYYFTDIVKIAKNKSINSDYYVTDEEYVLGINSRNQLAIAEEIYQKRVRNKFMQEGVTLINPASVTFSYDTKIDRDVIIEPNIVFGLGVVIESNVTIKSFSYIEGVLIKSGSQIGPFARIRPDSVILEDSKIGNFVEIKNSKISQDVKISHLSYIGDSEIGEGTNIGAGVITCNYDGFNKHKTIIGKNVSVGANNSLIAPVKIHDCSITAAGSVISKNIPENSIAISRPDLNILESKAEKFRNKLKSKSPANLL